MLLCVTLRPPYDVYVVSVIRRVSLQAIHFLANVLAFTRSDYPKTGPGRIAYIEHPSPLDAHHHLVSCVNVYKESRGLQPLAY